MVRMLVPVVCAALLAGLQVPSARAEPSPLVRKLNAYVECLNRLSERSYDSRARYFSWVGKNGPTGKERIIYGTYTIYDTSDCKQKVEEVSALEPRDAALEAAGAAYVTAVVALEPLLKEADEYYKQEDYKDDKMAKGKALHPRLVAAWTAFASADQALRARLDALQDTRAAEQLAEIERTEGRKAHFHIQTLMISAKRLVRTQNATPPDLPAIQAALAEYEGIVRAAEAFANETKESRLASDFIVSAKGLLVTSKHLMRRLRDKVPYSQGERLLLNAAGGSAMVEGSPGRLTRDYNQLIESFNRIVR